MHPKAHHSTQAPAADLLLHNVHLRPADLHHSASVLVLQLVVPSAGYDVDLGGLDRICTPLCCFVHQLVLVRPYLHRCATQGLQDVAQHLPRCATHYTVCSTPRSAGLRDCKGRLLHGQCACGCVLPDTHAGLKGVPAWGPGPLHAAQSGAAPCCGGGS